MFYFHKVAYVQYLGEVDIFSYMSKTFLPLYNSAKIIKIDEIFQIYYHQCTATFFMVHSVYRTKVQNDQGLKWMYAVGLY